MKPGIVPNWFNIFVVPVILMGLGMLARRLGRRDGDTSPQRNDLAVGTSVNLMSLGAVASDLRSPTNASDVIGLMAWLLAFVFITFLSIDHDRFRSWDRAEDGTLKVTKRIWMGIVVPNLVSMLMFASYQAQKLNP